MEFLLEKLRRLPIPADAVRFRNQSRLEAHLQHAPAADLRQIGRSRQGQALYGLSLGTGDVPVSLIAGCHADEPVGPMTAQALPAILTEHFPALLRQCRIHIVPQMNPDGADRNRVWFRDPLDFSAYIGTVQRETPGDDIEFGFGAGNDVRPECQAAMDFLQPHGPFAAHCSLHGLAYAPGVWFLVAPGWRGVQSLQDVLSAMAAHEGLPLLDVDRKGEKGFHRIAPGFSTTPNSKAMAEHFLKLGDPDMAAKFRPSSMEWVSSLGGNPLAMVSEVPLFLLDPVAPGSSGPAPGEAVKAALGALDGAAPKARQRGIAELSRNVGLRPVPLKTQIRIQIALVVFAIQHALEAV